MVSVRTFGWVDYLVFSLTIGISVAIGIFSALTGGKQKTTTEFLVGDRNMKVIPVALSLIVSYESAILMIGYPAEMYMYGLEFWLNSVGWCIGMIIVALVLVPTFYELKLISAYEYLQARFNSRIVRSLGAFFGINATIETIVFPAETFLSSYVIQQSEVWYMGIVLYAPAIALQAVTGFDVWYSVVVIAAVAIVYTTMGGIKAVIWADAFQSFVMLGGMFAIIIKGTMAVGGVGEVFALNNQDDRLKLFDFDINPTVRISFWGLTFGTIIGAFRLGTYQTSVQRIATMPSASKAKLIMIMSGPGFLVFGTLAFGEGLVAYAYYRSTGCDPLAAGVIENGNQIIPYFVMDMFADMPGLPGMFLAALFSASLSTLSSGYASVSAIVWIDFVKPYVKPVSEMKATIIAKVLVVVAGVASIGIAILVMKVGGPMNQIYETLMAAFGAPLAGLYLLGGLVPQANAKGAVAAVLASSAFSTWKSLGSSFSPNPNSVYVPNGNTDNCTLGNTTGLMYNTSIADGYNVYSVVNTTLPDLTAVATSPLDDFYSISFLWIAPLAMAIALIVGTTVSYATGGRDESEIDPRYLMFGCDRLFCCLPERVTGFFRYSKKDTQAKYSIQQTNDDKSEQFMHILSDKNGISIS